MLVSIPKISIVRAWTGAVCIRADGSVDPSTAPIQRNGNLYVLTGNINSDTAGIVIERSNIAVDGAGHIIQGTGNIGINITGRSNVTIINMKIQNFATSICIYNSTNCTISDNSIKAINQHAIWICASSSNLVFNNEIANRSTSGSGAGIGVCVGDSSYNIISRNRIFGVGYGIRASSGSNNSILENNIINSGTGIRTDNAFNTTISHNNLTGNFGCGISLSDSDKNHVFGNNIEDNKCGIEHESTWGGEYFSSNNAIFENLITNNDYGIVLRRTYDSKYYHNSFINNTIQVYDWSLYDPQWAPSEHIWDDGYPSGGNYWSDYVSVDFFQGPYQNETGDDGLGDSSYNIDARNIDHYPLGNAVGLIPAYPIAAFTYLPNYPIANQNVVFNASDSSCPNGTVETYYWNFGDGAYGWGIVSTHKYASYGSYNVTLTVFSNTRHTDNQTQSIIIRGKPAASFYYVPTVNAAVGQPVTFDASSSNPKGGTIETYIWDFGDGNRTLTPYQIITHTFPQGKTYNTTLTVLDSEGLNSSYFQLVKVWMPSFTSISTSSSSAFVGFALDINGTLYDIYGNGLENQTVVLYYAFPRADTWVPITSDITDQLGKYYINWIPPATGYFTIKAVWAGNSTHFGASNNISLSTIPYQNQYVFSVESNSTISVLAFNSTSLELSFTVTGETGTTGYVKVTIAKSFVSNIADVKVYLDGNLTEYSATSQDDAWILTFTYTHSIRYVTLDLKTATITGISPDLTPWIYFIIAAIVVALVSGIIMQSRRKKKLKEEVVMSSNKN
jgi:parallel beta-helix repeat protein